METGTEVNQVRIRINHHLARCGLGTRRAVEAFVRAGRVSCNGRVVTDLATTVDPDVDVIELDGTPLLGGCAFQYHAFYKPAGMAVKSAGGVVREDAAATAGRAVESRTRVLAGLGRLDDESEGLMIFTDDGDLVHAVTYPRYPVKTVFEVGLDRPLSDDDSARMISTGVEEGGQLLRAHEIGPLPGDGRPGFWYTIELHEARNRQLRRMLAACSYGINALRCVRLGPVRLGDLRVNRTRPLSPDEITALRALGFSKAGSAHRRRPLAHR